MPDLDDLILTLDRLHDVLGERPALWRTTTGIEVTQAIQHHRSRAGDAVGGTLLVERQDGIFGAYSTVTTLTPWFWPTVTPVGARRPRRPRTRGWR